MSDDAGKPRLLVLTSTFPRWKDDHEPPFVYELARRLTDRFEVTVLAPHAAGAKRYETMDDVDVHRFRYAPDSFETLAYAGGIPARLRLHPWLALLVPVFVLAQLVATYRFVRKLRPAAVHAHWLITGGLVAAIVSKLTSVPFRLVVTAHGADVYGLRHWLLIRLKRWVIERAKTVTVVSEALAKEVRALGIDASKVIVQGMGTDLSNLFVPCDRPSGPPTLVYAGRLVKKKGIDTFLKACAIVYRSTPDLHVIVAGHGPEQENLELLCEHLQITPIVEFSGPYTLSQLPKIYALASVAVFPFRAIAQGDQDGLGLAVVEAMGCGIPVVGSDISALDDLLVQDQTALRAAAEDAQAFALAIRASLSEPDASARRAVAARALVVERYDWKRVSEHYALLLSPSSG